MTSENAFLTLGKKRPLKFLAVLVLAIAIGACSDDDDDNNAAPPTQNIVATAQGNSNLSTLVTALGKYPDLVNTLSGNGEFTVFAPSNAAFADLLEAVGQTSLDDIPEDVLRSILEYHVIAGSELEAADLTTGDVETVSGEDISVSTATGVVLNGSAGVTTADVDATNGVVHVVDAVLVPPSMQPIVGTIVAPAYFNNDFSILVAAVVQAGLLETLLNPQADYTLFAPTNSAFEAAGITELPANNAEGNALLTSILTYHVINGTVMSTDLPETGILDPAPVETLGGIVYLSNKGDGVFLNGNTEVVATDIDASNGIVHIIDRTLVPPSKTIAEIAVEYSSADEPEFTQLVAALSKVPALLEAAGNDNATLTVFAPTDAAFEALYTALGVSNIDELVDAIGVDGLTRVLQHHIAGAVAFSSDLETGDVPTLMDESLGVDISALTISDGSGSTPPAALVPALINVHATNGVIHVIDKVLVPTL